MNAIEDISEDNVVKGLTESILKCTNLSVVVSAICPC